MLQGSRSCLNPDENIDFFCFSRQVTQLGLGHKFQPAVGRSASDRPGFKAFRSGPRWGRVCVPGSSLCHCSVVCVLLRDRLTAGLKPRSSCTTSRSYFPRHPSFVIFWCFLLPWGSPFLSSGQKAGASGPRCAAHCP